MVSRSCCKLMSTPAHVMILLKCIRYAREEEKVIKTTPANRWPALQVQNRTQEAVEPQDCNKPTWLPQSPDIKASFAYQTTCANKHAILTTK